MQQVACLQPIVRKAGQAQRVIIGVGAPRSGKNRFPSPPDLTTVATALSGHAQQMSLAVGEAPIESGRVIATVWAEEGVREK